MPTKTFIRPGNEGTEVETAELCSACECNIDATRNCRIFARRYRETNGDVVGRLDCPFNKPISVVDVHIGALRAGVSHRLRRVARARLKEDWTELDPEFEGLMSFLPENRTPVLV